MYGSTPISMRRVTVAGALSEEEGFTVFDCSTPANVGRDRFEAGLKRLRA